LIKTISKNISADGTPHLTLADSELIVPIESQSDLDHAIMLCKNKSINLVLQSVKSCKNIENKFKKPIEENAGAFIPELPDRSNLTEKKIHRNDEGFFIPEANCNQV
jgi:hypothetical protein